MNDTMGKFKCRNSECDKEFVNSSNRSKHLFYFHCGEPYKDGVTSKILIKTLGAVDQLSIHHQIT